MVNLGGVLASSGLICYQEFQSWLLFFFSPCFIFPHPSTLFSTFFSHPCVQFWMMGKDLFLTPVKKFRIWWEVLTITLTIKFSFYLILNLFYNYLSIFSNIGVQYNPFLIKIKLTHLSNSSLFIFNFSLSFHF